MVLFTFPFHLREHLLINVLLGVIMLELPFLIFLVCQWVYNHFKMGRQMDLHLLVLVRHCWNSIPMKGHLLPQTVLLQANFP